VAYLVLPAAASCACADTDKNAIAATNAIDIFIQFSF
jgi:hypothetical protein